MRGLHFGPPPAIDELEASNSTTRVVCVQDNSPKHSVTQNAGRKHTHPLSFDFKRRLLFRQTRRNRGNCITSRKQIVLPNEAQIDDPVEICRRKRSHCRLRPARYPPDGVEKASLDHLIVKNERNWARKGQIASWLDQSQKHVGPCWIEGNVGNLCHGKIAA